MRGRLGQIVLLAIGALVALGAGLLWLRAREDRARLETWDRIQARGLVRIGMDASYPPFGWVDAEGRFHGLDVDLAQALADRWGVEIELVNIHFDGLYDALYTDRVDLLLSALPFDIMLTQNVLYSQPYFAAGQMLLVAHGSEIASVNDLKGLTVAVELGTTAHHLARTLDRDRGLGLQVVPLRELDQAAQAVVAGEADATLADRVSAYRLMAAHPLRTVGEPLTHDPLVIAVRLESPRLLAEINAAIEQWLADGTMDGLIHRWLVP